MQSNKRWDERRKAILKTIGINFASKYIPMMIKIVDEWIDEVSIGADLDLSFELNKITFRIITKILFGRDIDKMDKCVYISPIDRTKQTLSFEECYFRYSKKTNLIAISQSLERYFLLLQNYHLLNHLNQTRKTKNQ